MRPSLDVEWGLVMGKSRGLTRAEQPRTSSYKPEEENQKSLGIKGYELSGSCHPRTNRLGGKRPTI